MSSMSPYPIPIVILAFAFIFLYITLLFLYKKSRFARRHAVRLEQAKQKGHVVTGVYASHTRYAVRPNARNTSYESYARYTYEVNGKTYVFVKRFKSRPPETLTLYYLDNPKKAFMEQKPADIVPFLLLCGTYFAIVILGYIFGLRP